MRPCTSPPNSIPPPSSPSATAWASSPGERVLVVTDEPLRTIGYAVFEAARDLGNDVLLVEMLPRTTNGEEPPPEVAALMTQFDVVLCPTSKSLTHTDSRRARQREGRPRRHAARRDRGGHGPLHERGLPRDRRAHVPHLRPDARRRRSIRVTAPAGTDITMPIEGREAHASSGLFREKGLWGNLPTGEAYLAPLEGLSNGVVVVDGSMASVGMVDEPIRIVVKDGYATDITGGESAQRLVALLEPHGKDARTVAEFGIGTNDKAILTGVILEDEKVMGTIHIAFGDNKSMGGTVRVASHLDGLVKQPTVWFDDRMVMEDGRLLV